MGTSSASKSPIRPRSINDDDADEITRRRLKRQRLFEQLSHETSTQQVRDEGGTQTTTSPSNNHHQIPEVSDNKDPENTKDSRSKEVKKKENCNLPIDTSTLLPDKKENENKEEEEEEEDSDDMFADTPPPEKQQLKLQKKQETLDQLVVGKKLAFNLLDNWDDAEGYYRIIPGELLDNRYLVSTTMGKGTFASVVRATDNDEDHRPVAIKIMRNNDTILKAGLQELALLQKLRDPTSDTADDPTRTKHVVQLLSSFDHKGHLCLVFEYLDANLRDVLHKFGRSIGINLAAVRAYARQLLRGLDSLRRAAVIHSDLKPDNILVTDSHAVLKICDLGSAVLADNHHNATGTADCSVDSSLVVAPYLASRFYRAPELILGLPRYDTAIDMWAAGCTLFEMYTGQVLFPGKSNNDMLRLMMAVRGKFSNKMLRKGAFTGIYFHKNRLDDFISTLGIDPITNQPITKTITITGHTHGQTIKDKLAGLEGPPGSPSARMLDKFIDLLNQMLALNPEKRPTPAQTLAHPFFA
ncbi:uncharacterized protein SAPINGB_P002211 [Magnusiomyces paraingens]|uniref:Protein kinase domain-containing protein n=1 Tax=Magnusiomyces paraingens TaxID=2606893 RepID=A0A5E8BKP2_9ASCO|nr:uncharacterized protein SAPINGB_P002211 [Saprochaete ingens]VVT49318.1 unnamed protein product [Saprochaete ingens]